MDSAAVIAQVCERLARDGRESAASFLRENYPFVARDAVERKYGVMEALRVFVRDGFVDRYSGSRLIFPGALRLLSALLPEDFPFHPNWKMSQTHVAYWQLTPTVDHVTPVCLGGADSEENWLTTSMLRNSAKANWTLEQLGWTVHPPGRLEEWDGQLSWFRTYIGRAPGILEEVPGLRPWYRAAIALPVG